MRSQFYHARRSFGPALAVGLFCGRFFSELWAQLQRPSAGISLIIVLAITVTCTLMASWLLRKLHWSRTWPLLLLAIYPFFPEHSPQVALTSIVIAMTIIGRQRLGCRLSGQRSASLIWWLLLPTILFFILYVSTLAPDVLPADSGEFQLVAANLGVAHPPGFALFTLLGHVMTWLPGPGTPALKVNLLSAITSTLTLAILFLVVFHITADRLASLTALVALGSSTTYWSQATTSNVRSLTGLFTSLAIYSGLLYWSTSRHQDSDNEKHRVTDPPFTRHRPDYYLFLFALALSSGIVHHPSLLFIGSVLLVFVVVADPALLRMPRRWIKPFLAGLVSLLPLLYLPWQGILAASGQTIRGASSGLATWPGFLNHVLALGFRGDLFYFLEPTLLWERIKVIGNVMTFQFSLWLLLGMGVGSVLLLRQQRRLALLLGGSFAIHALVTATYRAPQTVEYMMPAYILAAISLGYGVASAGKRTPLREDGRSILGQTVVAIVFVAAGAQVLEHYPSYRYLHQETSARSYAQFLLDEAPPDAVILADWHWVTPLWYLQEVEGQRTDVDIRFVFPTDEPYGDTWVRRIRENYEQGRPVLSTHFDESAISLLPVPEPVGEAFLYRQEPRHDLPPSFTALELTLGDAIQILGYQLSQTTVPIAQETVLTLAWRPLTTLASSTTLFAHLVGNDGQIYGQQDPPARPKAEGISLTQFRLIPRLGSMPGVYTIMIGANDQVSLLDEGGQPRTAIAKLTVQTMSQPPITNNPTYRQLSGAASPMRLVGYDWDNTLPDGSRLYLHWQAEAGYQTEVIDRLPKEKVAMPTAIGPWGIVSNWSLPYEPDSHYVPFAQGIVWTGPLLEETAQLRPGSTVWLRQTFRVNQPVTRDISTSVRLIGYDTGGYLWDWWDLDDDFGVPAMGGIPTLKWIAGSIISDAHQLQVSEKAYSGQIVGAALGLYDTFTGRPLSVLDQRFTRESAWRLTQISPAN